MENALVGSDGMPVVGALFYRDDRDSRLCPSVAGALEGLVSTAHMLLELGVATPFLVS